MSNFQTHALIGAVGGLALSVARDTSQVWITSALRDLPSGTAGTIVIIIASALLALTPDIDEPGSFISRHARGLIVLVYVAIGIILAIDVGTILAIALGVIGGAAAGVIIGDGFLRLIRTAAGGHRRFTHSLVLAGVLAFLAMALNLTMDSVLWIVPAGLAWGIVLHVVGDVVTPSGVPLFYPFSSFNVRVLPEPICKLGEPLIIIVALAAGWFLLC